MTYVGGVFLLSSLIVDDVIDDSSGDVISSRNISKPKARKRSVSRRVKDDVLVVSRLLAVTRVLLDVERGELVALSKQPLPERSTKVGSQVR